MRGHWQGGCACARVGPRRVDATGDRALSAIVEFDSVGLRYGTGAEVLRDLDFRLGRGRLLFPHRPVGRRQDVAAETALPRPAADARPDPPVRRGTDRGAARSAARLPPPDRRRVPGLPPDPPSVGVRQCRAAAAHRRQERGRGRRPGARDARLGRARRPGQRPAGDPVGRRAAARRDRPRGDRPARDAGRRRADRQRRCRNGGAAAASVRGAQPARHDGRRRHPRRGPDRRDPRGADGAARESGSMVDPTGALKHPPHPPGGPR